MQNWGGKYCRMSQCPYCYKEFKRTNFWLDNHLLFKHGKRLGEKSWILNVFIGLVIAILFSGGGTIFYINVPYSEKALENLSYQKIEQIETALISQQLQEFERKNAPNWKKLFYFFKDNVTAFFKYLQEQRIKRSIELSQKNYDKGLAYFYLDDYEQALYFFEETIGNDPNNFNAYFFKGLILPRFEKYAEALQAFNKAIEIKPDFKEALIFKGRLLAYLGNYDEALVSFDEASKVHAANLFLLPSEFYLTFEIDNIDATNATIAPDTIKSIFDEMIASGKSEYIYDNKLKFTVVEDYYDPWITYFRALTLEKMRSYDKAFSAFDAIYQNMIVNKPKQQINFILLEEIRKKRSSLLEKLNATINDN